MNLIADYRIPVYASDGTFLDYKIRKDAKVIQFVGVHDEVRAVLLANTHVFEISLYYLFNVREIEHA